MWVKKVVFVKGKCRTMHAMVGCQSGREEWERREKIEIQMGEF